MKTDSQWAEIICRPYCVYFKTDMQENLGCYGVSYIIENWDLHAFNSFLAKMPPESRWEDADEDLLERTLCQNCPYLEDDCDYRDPDGPDDAQPCGGYVILGKLMASGVKEVLDKLESD